ncbi:MAG: SGNH/GDSL hydrolase family protein [Hyphomicrobiaceae bacterium]|nr:SGNH/GDSL hydrolase family protein [Hyphomicrobiaceae bacterium]
MRKVILVNLLVLIAGLSLLELVFGSWFSNTPVLYNFTKPRNIQKTYESGFPGQPAVSTYTIDGYGLRGLDKGLREIFILTVGGSTTDQKYIDDNFTFEAWLQKFFADDGRDVDVVSAGIDGQSSFGHLKNFDFWFEKLPQLRPSYIMYYVGINDFYNLREVPKFDRLEVVGLKANLRAAFAYAKDRSALIAGARVAKSLVMPPAVAHFRSSKPVPFSEKKWTTRSRILNYQTPVVAESLAQLRSRILKLADKTRQIGAEPIFVTQRSINWIKHDNKIWGLKNPLYRPNADALNGWGQMTGVDHYALEQLQAGIIMDACRERKGVCINLARDISINHLTDFYDAVHTTPVGSRRIAEFLYSRLREIR